MIIFLYGENTFLSRRKLNELKAKFIREVDPSGNSVVVLGGEDMTVEKINEAVGTPSLFSRRRMIVVEKILARKDGPFREQILTYLKTLEKEKDKEGDNIIIIWNGPLESGAQNSALFRFLSRLKYAQNFKALSNTETAAWIKAEVGTRGGKIKNRAAVGLAGLAGGNLWRIANEIDKLIAFKRSRQKGLIADTAATPAEIEENDVEELVRGNFDENIFALTDALGGKKRALAMMLFEREIDAGADENYLWHMIARQFRIMLQVRQALDLSHGARKIAGELKLHPYVVQKCLLAARGFSLPSLKILLGRLMETDRKMKTGLIKPRTAITMLIAEI